MPGIPHTLRRQEAARIREAARILAGDGCEACCYYHLSENNGPWCVRQVFASTRPKKTCRFMVRR